MTSHNLCHCGKASEWMLMTIDEPRASTVPRPTPYRWATCTKHLSEAFDGMVRQIDEDPTWSGDPQIRLRRDA